MADRDLNRGATYCERGLADGDVAHFASLGILSQVVQDGRYWRVDVFPVSRAMAVPVRIENRLRTDRKERSA